MQLPRKETIEALEPIKAALAARGDAIVEKTHIWFDGEYAFATDGGLGVKVKFESPVKCGVPGALFFGLLDQVAADQLKFDYADNVIKMKAGRSTMKIATLPLERGTKIWRFPDKPGKTKAAATIEITEKFLENLARVLAMKPTEKKHMEHHAVCIFAVDGGEMDLYTTDYPRSLVVTSVNESIVGSAKKLALPRSLAEQIVAQCSPGEPLQMFADHFVTKASERVTLFSNVFDTAEMLDLPMFAERYSNNKTSPLVPIPDGLTAALERALLLAGVEEPVVHLTTKAKSLTFSGDFKLGRVDEEFELEKSAATGSITVDAKTLLSVKDVKKLAIFSGAALSLHGDDGYMYVMSAKEGPKKDKAPTQKGNRSGKDTEDPPWEDNNEGDDD